LGCRPHPCLLGADVTEEQLKFVAYLINPWNAAVVLVVVLAIELLKRSFKEFFSNGNLGNKMLRFMCVGGCIVGYFVPGPWIDSAATFVPRLFMGGLLGLATTMGFEFIGGVINVFKRLVVRKNADKEHGSRRPRSWVLCSASLQRASVASTVPGSSLRTKPRPPMK
jgi:hypothetical protein